MALLEVKNLKTYFRIKRGYVKAVDDVSFQVEKGEAMGLAGESGCGKTTTALTILKILPSNGEIKGGKIFFSNIDLLEISEEKMRKDIRWKGISIVFQGAMNAFNPVYKVGDQIIEAIRVHEDITREEAVSRTKKLLELVGIDPSRFDNYPHEFSGGMKQRALIAMALACNPSLLIADEPGTALDVVVQAQILKLMRELKDKLNLSMILITHDLSIIAETCEKITIMYAGKIVEHGNSTSIFHNPLHPYTSGLISAFPNIKGPRTRVTSIPGTPPDLLHPPSGCRFHPRCRYAMDICKKEEPVEVEVEKDHFVACHFIKR
ncbi:MAG: ABC transporter ATP-binding protein [Candidatus Bathyarchaeia archaeon]